MAAISGTYEKVADAIRSNTEVNDLLAAGAALTRVITDHGGTPAIIVPKNCELRDLEALLPCPMRVRAHPRFVELASFVAYVKRHATPGTCVFVDLAGLEFVAVLDHPQANEPQWMSHKATFRPEKSVDWNDWLANANRLMGQMEFARFLEDRARLIAEPDGAMLSKLVLHLEGHAEARFNSAVRMQTGAIKLTFEEDVSVKGNLGTGTGQMELPEKIVVGLQPFDTGAFYKLEAHLRVRTNDRKLSLFYEPIRADLVVRDAVNHMVESLRLEELTVYLGKQSA